MFTHKHNRTAAIVIAAVLFAVGCVEEHPGPVTEQNNVIPPSDISIDDSFDSIMRIVDGADRTADEISADWEAGHNRIQELIAACMRQRGFDYIPVPPESSGAASDATLIHPENRDWVAQWGYMIVNRPYKSEAQDRLEIVQTDPNTEALNLLGEAERNAFNTALEGSEPLYEDGCRNWAYQQPTPPTPADLKTSNQFAPLFEALAEMYASLESVIAEPERAWSECMANAGFPGFDRPRDAAESISSAYVEWNNSQNWDNWDWATMGDPNSTNTPELAPLAEREVEIALADFDCRATTNFDARMQDRQREAENQFYNDNRATFRALRDAVEQMNWS